MDYNHVDVLGLLHIIHLGRHGEVIASGDSIVIRTRMFGFRSKSLTIDFKIMFLGYSKGSVRPNFVVGSGRLKAQS
ncbi:MAG: hypothetical protein BA873_05580 [Desulfobulbaceae bacterium C00003063]|nr:MAG: hypothetical protein BA873_05580 [Desulfobulbaceae bacterium C00003063]OEU84046.1 MAG: hypothetical protein BA865_03065 [Desulfobacterales bacterium S5133MH4]